MKAVILAAGRGKRMGRLTNTKPKPLLRVGGKTFLDHIFDALPPVVESVVVVVGYKGNLIRAYLGKHYKGKKVFYVKQKNLSGTGHAVLLTKSHFKKPGEKLFIIYGDEPTRRRELEACLKHPFAWLCIEVQHPERSGIASLSKTGRIVKVVEKPKRPKSNLAAAGVMLVDTDIFRYKPKQHSTGEHYLTDMMDRFLKTHPVYAVRGRKHISFSTPEDIRKFGKKLKNKST